MKLVMSFSKSVSIMKYTFLVEENGHCLKLKNENRNRASCFFFLFFFLHIQFKRFQTERLQSSGTYISRCTWDPTQKPTTN